jgi:hypothetical protein
MKFRITVQETVIVTYDVVEIEAETEEKAYDIAEEMRVQDQLGKPTEAVDDVDYYAEDADE